MSVESISRMLWISVQHSQSRNWQSLTTCRKVKEILSDEEEIDIVMLNCLRSYKRLWHYCAGKELIFFIQDPAISCWWFHARTLSQPVDGFAKSWRNCLLLLLVKSDLRSFHSDGGLAYRSRIYLIEFLIVKTLHFSNLKNEFAQGKTRKVTF